MSLKERLGLEGFGRVRDRQIVVKKAAELLELSERQAWRIWRRYREAGDAGLIHGLRGKAGNGRLKPSLKQKVLELYREKYDDFGPTLAAEKLAEQGLGVRRET